MTLTYDRKEPLISKDTARAARRETAGACLAFGKDLYQQKRYKEALDYFKKTLQFEATNTNALFGAGKTCSALAQYDDAIAYYTKALAEDATNIDVMRTMAELYNSLENPKEALVWYVKILEVSPKAYDAYWSAAQIMERMGLIRKAVNFVTKARTLFPEDPSLQLMQGTLLYKLGNIKEAAERIKAALDNPKLPKEKHYIAYAYAALIYDGRKNFGQAFYCYEQANQTLRDFTKLSGGATLAVAQIAKGIANWLPKQDTTGWEVMPKSGDKAPVFLVGFPHSGQQMIEGLLTAHPQIFSTHDAPIVEKLIYGIPQILGVKKVNYPQIIGELTQEQIIVLRRAYHQYAKQLFGNRTNSIRIIDTYRFNIAHIGFIHRIFPEARIVVAIRDPRDVVLDSFRQLYRLNTNTSRMTTLVDTAELYREMMQLYTQYNQYLSLPLKVVRLEDVEAEPLRAAQEILGFIGMGWDEAVKEYKAQQAEYYQNRNLYHNRIEPVVIEQTGAWANYAASLKPVMPVLTSFIERYGYSV
jgi:tetratricopeptide (TPR) repeat protein